MDANNFNIQNVKSPVNSHDVISLSFLSNELSNYAYKTGTDFAGDIDMQNNSIYGIQNVDNNNSAVNKKYVANKISKIKQNSIDLTPYLKKDGSILMTNDFNLNNNKIKKFKKETGNKDAVNLEQLNEANSVIESNITKAYLKKDGSNLDSNLSVNNKKILILQHLLIKMIVQTNYKSINK